MKGDGRNLQIGGTEPNPRLPSADPSRAIPYPRGRSFPRLHRIGSYQRCGASPAPGPGPRAPLGTFQCSNLMFEGCDSLFKRRSGHTFLLLVINESYPRVTVSSRLMITLTTVVQTASFAHLRRRHAPAASASETRSINSLSAALPGTITEPWPSASCFTSSRSLALRALTSGPWQA